MTKTKLDQLSQVTRARYLMEFQKVRSILNEESRVRGALMALDDQVKHNNQTKAENGAMQTIGADVLWHGWVSRTRRQLNIELAQVLAKKLSAMDGVQRAFGQQAAVEQIASRERTEKAKAKARAFYESLLNQT